MFIYMKSVQVWLSVMGELFVQFKFFIEGEEECGSEGLNEFFVGKYVQGGESIFEKLVCDVVVISDLL